MHKWLLLVIGAVGAAGVQAQTVEDCPAGSRPLLILGTFHMVGSTQDAVSTRAGDMTTPRRQAEIEQVVASLARFRPTKIAIESSRLSTYYNTRYQAWLDGRQALDVDEVEQIGFRLARRLQLPAMTPVDYPMWMDGSMAIDRHEPKPKPAAPQPAAAEPESRLLAGVRAQVSADEARLAQGTLADYLVYINSPARALVSHQWDVISNLEPGDDVSLYANTDLATNWYKRNLRIYTNIVDAAGPADRVLLIIGAGHTHLLSTLAAEDPRFCLVDEASYLR